MPEKPCIIITRPLAEAQITAGILAKNGLDSFIEPMLSIKPIATAARQLGEIMPGCAALIISSRNAARAIIHLNKNTRIIALGKATTAFIKEQGFVNVAFAGVNSQELCHYIRNNYCGEKLLYACGNKVNTELTFDNCGNNIHKLIMYKSVATQKFSQEFTKNLFNNKFSGVMFCSKRTALSFCKLVIKERLDENLKNLHGFCFSHNIAESIKNYGFKATTVAENPNLEAIIALIAKFRFA